MPRLDVARFLALTSALASGSFAACAARQTPEPETAPTVAVVNVPDHEEAVEDEGDGGAPIQVIEEPADQPPEQAPYYEGAPYEEYMPDPGGEAGLAPRPNGALRALLTADAGVVGVLGSGGLGGLSGIGTTKSPPVRTGSPKLVGALPPEVVRRIVRSHVGSIRHCYEKQLLKSPKLSGKLAVRFVIAADGSVASANRHTGGVHPAVDSCIVSVFRRMRFPSPSGGGVVVVNYPLIFTSK